MSIYKFLQRIAFFAFIIFLVATGCSNDESYVGDTEESPILKGLKDLRGEYVWKEDVNRFIYSEKLAIEEIISPSDTELVIETLVNCLDKSALSNSTIKGKKVALGVICYEALSQIAYYESTSEEGDLKQSWPGHILPTATPTELQEAKRAWKGVVDSKSYILKLNKR